MQCDLDQGCDEGVAAWGVRKRRMLRLFCSVEGAP